MKFITRFRYIFTLTLFLVATGQAVTQPSLGIAPAGTQSILYYSPTATNYILQSTTNLPSPNWSASADATPTTAITVSNTTPAPESSGNTIGFRCVRGL